MFLCVGAVTDIFFWSISWVSKQAQIKRRDRFSVLLEYQLCEVIKKKRFDPHFHTCSGSSVVLNLKKK